jgi:hypothetical protein
MAPSPAIHASKFSLYNISHFVACAGAFLVKKTLRYLDIFPRFGKKLQSEIDRSHIKE